LLRLVENHVAKCRYDGKAKQENQEGMVAISEGSRTSRICLFPETSIVNGAAKGVFFDATQVL